LDKCIICRAELCKNDDDVCETCRAFFEWKHEKDFKKHFEKLKKYFSKKSNSIKFWRAK